MKPVTLRRKIEPTNFSSAQEPNVTQCEPAAKLDHLFPEMQAQKPTGNQLAAAKAKVRNALTAENVGKTSWIWLLTMAISPSQRYIPTTGMHDVSFIRTNFLV